MKLNTFIVLACAALTPLIAAHQDQSRNLRFRRATSSASVCSTTETIFKTSTRTTTTTATTTTTKTTTQTIPTTTTVTTTKTTTTTSTSTVYTTKVVTKCPSSTTTTTKTTTTTTTAPKTTSTASTTTTFTTIPSTTTTTTTTVPFTTTTEPTTTTTTTTTEDTTLTTSTTETTTTPPTTTTTITTTTSTVPSSCPQFGTGQQITYPKSGPFDRYVATCSRNYFSSSSSPPVEIPGVADYKSCLDRCSISSDWIAATYRQSDQYCYCFYDYNTYQVGDEQYDGAFKIPSTSPSCDYVPPAVERATAANQARFVLYGSSTFGSTGGVAFIRSVRAADKLDCANLCANDSTCVFFTFGLNTNSCFLYNNNGGAGICPTSNNGEISGVRVTPTS